VKHDSLLISLLARALQEHLQRAGFAVVLEYQYREGPDLVELRRGSEIASLSIQVEAGDIKRLAVESSGEAVAGEVAIAVEDLLNDLVFALAGPLSPLPPDAARKTVADALSKLWEELGMERA